MQPLKLVFAGTPEFAAEHLKSLIEGKHEVAAVFTRPDQRAGRGKKLLASPVKRIALDSGILVHQPANFKEPEDRAPLSQLNPEVLVVVAYGLILPQSVLDIPRYGCINVHASLLPRWRGAAPIERAIMAGDTQSGTTIMQMDAGLDTGNMIAINKVTISDTDTSESLTNALAKAGCSALSHVLNNYAELRKSASAQDNSLSTYAKKMAKSDSLIDWCHHSHVVNCQLRACYGRHPAYSFLNEGRIRFLMATAVKDDYAEAPGTIIKLGKDFVRIACADSSLDVYSVQFPGKKAVNISDLFNSNIPIFTPGEMLISQENPTQ